MQIRRSPGLWLFWALCFAGSGLFIWSGQRFLAHNGLNDADSSFFIYGGWVLLEGGELYRDFWDQKPPAIFWQNALLLWLFGRDMGAWAWVHAIAYIGLALWWFREMAHRVDPWVVGFGVLCLSYAFNSNKVLDFGNRTEFGVALFEGLALCALLTTWRTGRAHWMMLAGLFTGLAFLYKPVGMASLLATLAWSLWAWKERRRWVGIHVLFFLLTVLILPSALGVNLVAMAKASILTPLGFTVGANVGIVEATGATIRRLGPFWGVLVVSLGSPWLFFSKESEGRSNLSLWMVLWFGATLCGVVLQRHGRPHYDHTLMVPLVSVAVLVVHRWTLNRKVWQRFTILMVWFMLVVWLSRYFVMQQWSMALHWPERQKERYASYERLGTYLREHLKAEEKMYYWSMGFMPYILAEQQSPGRLSPSMLTFGGAGAQMVREDLDQVKNRDEVILLIENPETWPEDLSTPEAYAHLPLARAVIKDYLAYREAHFEVMEGEVLSPFIVYQRKALP